MAEAPAQTLLCITPSPAIDRTAHVAHVEAGEILRPRQLVVLPGGKGVNAARAAFRLGGGVMTSGIAGGHAGRWIVEALAEEELGPRFSYAEAESRTTYVTVDDDGASVIVYERPSPVTEAEFEAFLRLLGDDLLPRCERALVAGSVPGGIGPAGHGRIVEVCRQAGRALLVDASGPGLLAALEQQPDLVKIGRVEAVEAGLAAASESTLEVALALVARGAVCAVVTDGAREVAAADAATTWSVSVPEVPALNAVGSGDSFNAGMSLALMAGASMDEALRKGVAAGAANALTLGAGMLDPDVAHQLEGPITVTSAGR